jgi:hypothetical protein
MPYVTGSAILQHVAGSGAPSADAEDEAWADVCAAAVEGAIADRLDGGALTPTTEQDAQLTAAALQDGAALYVARKAPHGVLSIGPDGDVARLGSAILRASDAILYRISPGIG